MRGVNQPLRYRPEDLILSDGILHLRRSKLEGSGLVAMSA
jgi:hypothetical protein